MAFADVEIRILRQEPGKGYPVEIRVDELRHFPRGYLQAGSSPASPTDAHYADQGYGQELFRWFFADPQLAENWAEIRGADRPRRIRLFIDADQAELAELHRWPWEALWEPVRGGEPARPLASDPDTPFSRYLAVKAALANPISRRPIRILVVAPRQADFEGLYPRDKYPDMAAIDPESEFRSLLAALQPLVDQGAVDMRLLPQPCSLAAMAGELSRARAEGKGYHVLHLISHGFHQNEQAFLLLADADNRVKREADQDILPVLRQQPRDAEDEGTLRLVFLASCETARRSSADAFRGLAPQLVRAGLPAVVAMQAQVGEQTARQFAAKFYQHLLRHGQVDLAANEARQILFAARLPGPVIPVLFLRLRDGRLFAHPEAAPARRRLQAPLPPDTFTGRADVLERLSQALTSWPDAQVAVAIHGTGGQGKSTVARVLGRDLEEAFPGGVLWVDAGGTGAGAPNGAAGDAATLAEQQASILGIVALELGLDLKDVPRPEDRAALVRAELGAGGRLLAIVDDVWHPDVGCWLMREVLPDRRAVLVTTRLLDVAKALGSPVERLGVLSDDEGAEMLSRFLGPLGRHEAAARQVVTLLEGLPLALELAARRCDEGAGDLPWLLRQLQSKPTLGVLTLPGRTSRETSVEYTLSLSLQGLDEDLARRFRAVGVFAAAPFDLAALGAVWQDEDLDASEEVARELVRRALLGRGEERLPAGAAMEVPVYVQHALLRGYALALAQRAGEADDSAGRHAGYYRALPGESWQQGELFWSQVEHAWRWADGRTLDERLDFLYVIQRFAARRGLWEPVRRRAEELLAELQASEERSGDQASLLSNLGYVADALGDKAEALAFYEQALPLRRQVGDKAGEATTLNNIGGVHSALGDKAQALAFYEQALALSRQVGDKAGEATTLNNMALIAYRDGRVSEAAGLFRQVIQVFHDLGAVAEEAAVMANLAGLLHMSGGDRAEAAQWMEASIAALTGRRLARDAMGQTLVQKQAFLAELTGQAPAQPQAEAGQFTLDKLLALARQARDGNQELAGQLVPFLEQLSTQEDAPPEVQALARVLLQLLAGEAFPDVSGLPPELGAAIREGFGLVEP